MSDEYTYLSFYRPYLDYHIPTDATANEKGWVSIKCPFHEDTRPSAAISIIHGGIHCLACDKTWTPVNFLVEHCDFELTEAIATVERIREEHNLIVDFEASYQRKIPVYKKEFDILYRQAQKYMSIDREVVQTYIAERGVSYQTLLDLGIGCLPPEAIKWNHEVIVFPYFLNGKVVGLRYRDVGHNKGCQPDSFWTLAGLDAFEDEPDLSSKILIITEGETDRLRTYQALKNAGKTEYYVVSTPSCVFDRSWKRELEGFFQVIVLPQSDANSAKMAESIRKIIPNIEVIELPWKRKQYPHKDVADWLRFHSDADLVKLIDAAVKSKPRKVQTWSEFKASVSEQREWLIDNLFSLNQIFTLLGPAKSGKTFVALNMVRSLITGEDFLGLPQLSISSNVEETKILFWEEEGAESEFLERTQWVFQGISDSIIEEQVFFASHLGLKLDTDEWMEVISKEIEQKNINLVVFDPFSRLFSCDENDSSEMGAVWSRLATLQNRHKRTSFLIIHHTSKAAGKGIGEVDSPLDGARGSGRTASEVDGGIIVSKHMEKDKVSAAVTNYIKCRFEGRFADITNADGDPVFKLKLGQDGLIIPITALNLPRGRGAKLYRLLEANGHEMTIDQILKASEGSITKVKIKHYSSSYVDTNTGEYLINYDEATGVVSTNQLTGF